MATFQLLFQGTVDSPTGPYPENRVVDQDIGSPSRPVSSGLQVPGEPGHFHARAEPTPTHTHTHMHSHAHPSI
jgi:hypothetical protein